MHTSPRAIILATCLVLAGLAVSTAPVGAPRAGVPISRVAAQEPDPSATWQVVVNQARLDEGLAAYSLSSLLAAAAQRYADDLATHQAASHTGSDGSTPQQRILEAGYAAWNEGGEPMVGENFWTGYGTVEDALAFFMDDPAHRDNILSLTFREMGIGAATDVEGRNYYVLDFGARPNVLPIFINDGAANTDDPQVAVRLTNEEARPEGKGATFMGRAIEIRINNEPNFEDRPWQRWEPLIPWTLPDTPGEHTVYVQFRDAAGRTAASADAIVLGEGIPSTPTSLPASPIPEPTITPLSPSATPEVAAPPSDTPATTSPPVAPPTVEPTPTSPAPGSSLLPPISTPFPTWTPLPTPTLAQEASTPDMPLGLVAALQGLALILGLYLVLHRGHRGGDGQNSEESG